MNPRILIPAYLAVVVLPLGLAWAVGGPPRPVLRELASGLGMLAYAMILVEFVLSGRFKRVSNRVGMDVTMRFHQVMARTALVFALLHPLLYGGSAAGGARPWDPTRQLTITTDLNALSSGIAALLVLGALVLLAVGRRQLDYRYETWRLMHGAGAVLVAGLLLHHTLSAGRYGAQAATVWMWAGLTGLAVASLIYVYIVEPLRQRARPWRVVSVRAAASRQWEVTITPDGHEGLDYTAGQFAWLNIGNSAFSLHENPFSIVSAPAGGPEISFLIKEFGDFTRKIGQVAPGTRAYIDGAYGSLTVEGRHEPGIALIAGGVGIAPLLGILRQLRATSDPRQVRIVYGNRTEAQIAYREALEAEDTCLVLAEPPADWGAQTGVVTPALIDRLFSQDDLETWLFVICGPSAMMDIVEDHLIARGTPSHRILTERFDYD